MKFVIYVENENSIEIQKIADIHKNISDPLVLITKQPPKVLNRDYVKEVEVVTSDDEHDEVRTYTSKSLQWLIQWNSVMKIHRFLNIPKGMDAKSALLRIMCSTSADLIVSGCHDVEIAACDYYGAGGEFLTVDRL